MNILNGSRGDILRKKLLHFVITTIIRVVDIIIIIINGLFHLSVFIRPEDIWPSLQLKYFIGFYFIWLLLVFLPDCDV